MTLTITHRELKDLIAPVLPHVDGSGMLPVLGCVSFQTRGGYLTATATDRYTIAVTRLAVDSATEFTALVQAVKLKALLAMFKPSRYNDGQSLTLTLEENDLRVEGSGALFSSAVIKYSLYKGEYPSTSAMFTAKDPESASTFSLNGNLLAKFRLGARVGEPLTFSNRGKRTYVRSGDHFMGIIMQVNDVPDANWDSIFVPIKADIDGKKVA